MNLCCLHAEINIYEFVNYEYMALPVLYAWLICVYNCIARLARGIEIERSDF